MIEDDEGVASGHARENPPLPEMRVVVLVWVMLGSVLTLSIFVLVLVVSELVG